jgi:malate dehydrogenase (oxaloacetate-decarboxylating)
MGAGTAGIGIADQIYDALKRAGLNEKEACACLWLIDKPGLLTDTVSLLPAQARYARQKEEVHAWQVRNASHIDLYDVVKNVRPTILIGCSTVAGAFTQEIVEQMAAQVERPIIMPLSNPTSLSEATPEDLLRWTKAKAIIATGSPFADVYYENKRYRIAQSNNAFAFPGIGLGCLAVKAKHISDNMLWAATEALSRCSPVYEDKMAPLLPKLAEAKMVSKQVALAVATEACKEGVAQLPSDHDLKHRIEQLMWEPHYYPYKK